METKAREFWIDNYETIHDKRSASLYKINKERYIHVIEYSAYEKLQKRVDELEASKIHTCHDDCQRIECVQRRKIEELEVELQCAKAHAEVMEHKATRVNAMLRDRDSENKKLREALRRIRHHVIGFKSNGEILQPIS